MGTNDKHLLTWCGKIMYPLMCIKDIKYKVVRNTSSRVSKRVMRFNEFRYKVYSTVYREQYLISRINENICVEIINLDESVKFKGTHKYPDRCDIWPTSPYGRFPEDIEYIIVETMYNSCRLKKKSKDKYKILKTIRVLRHKIAPELLLKLVIAFGRDIYYAYRSNVTTLEPLKIRE
jgi:hypothetical protein